MNNEPIDLRPKWRCKECDAWMPNPDGQVCEECKLAKVPYFSRSEKLFILLLLLWVAFQIGRAYGGVVTEDFLDSIAQRESGNNPHAVGKAGEVTAYQLKPCAVRDVNKYFGWTAEIRALRQPSVARAYARGFCLILEQRMTAVCGRYPSEAELYRAYQLGFRGWIRTTQGHGGPANFPTQIRPTPRTPDRESTGRLVAAPRRLASQQATGPGLPR